MHAKVEHAKYEIPKKCLWWSDDKNCHMELNDLVRKYTHNSQTLDGRDINNAKKNHLNNS